MAVYRLATSFDQSTIPLSSHPTLLSSLILPLMHGKHARTASSSPHYERVIWIEKKTARGSRITGKVSNSPQTPRIRKQATPHSKKRRLEVSPVASIGSGAGVGHSLNPPMLIKLKPKPGKVSLTIPSD